MLCIVIHCTGHILTNTRPHQLHQEMDSLPSLTYMTRSLEFLEADQMMKEERGGSEALGAKLESRAATTWLDFISYVV